jgi:hypothetical protein
MFYHKTITLGPHIPTSLNYSSYFEPHSHISTLFAHSPQENLFISKFTTSNCIKILHSRFQPSPYTYTYRSISVGHKGRFGHEFLEFEFRPGGKLRYANNSHYKNETMIRKEGTLFFSNSLHPSNTLPLTPQCVNLRL